MRSMVAMLRDRQKSNRGICDWLRGGGVKVEKGGKGVEGWKNGIMNFNPLHFTATGSLL